MENKLQEVTTYSFFDFDEVIYFINSNKENMTNVNMQKQIETMDGNEIEVWIVSIVKDFI